MLRSKSRLPAPIARMRAAIADGFLPRYRRIMEKEFRRQATEVADRVAAGMDFDGLVSEWAARMVEVQRGIALSMAIEGYRLAETEIVA